MLLSLAGILAQIRFIFQRKKLYSINGLQDEKPTSVLSLNRFATSFLGFYSMFFYGLTLNLFNHYIVWPRIIALALLLIILYEIKRDRNDITSISIFYAGLICVSGAIALAVTPYRIVFSEIYLSHIFSFVVTCIFAQGAAHQIYKIRKSGRTGGLSLRMHQLYATKDFSAVLFGVAMSVEKGWPVIFQHSVSFCVQFITMYHFRWVKVSESAIKRKRLAMTE